MISDDNVNHSGDDIDDDDHNDIDERIGNQKE